MQLDRYEVMCREDGSLSRLGQGKTSSSYKALDLDLHVPVVLKVINPELLEDENAKAGFLREARAAALPRHPNVAAIYRLGSDGGAYFYAREFVEGETLEAKVARDGPLDPKAVLDIALQAARALSAVQKVDLIHHNIRPSNLMLTAEGTLKIIGFGGARRTGTGIDEPKISVIGFAGAPEYASPEQLNEVPLDLSSDIYSLGATLWFLLTGYPPFRGPMAQVMACHIQNPPPFEELSMCPPAVVSLLAHMLEKDPANRPATPAQLAEEIQKRHAVLEGGPPHPAPLINVKPEKASAKLTKMTASRIPAPERHRRHFLFAEVMAGAVVALIVYLVCSRPVGGTDISPAADPHRPTLHEAGKRIDYPRSNVLVSADPR